MFHSLGTRANHTYHTHSLIKAMHQHHKTTQIAFSLSSLFTCPSPLSPSLSLSLSLSLKTIAQTHRVYMNEEVVICVVDGLEQSLDLSVSPSMYGHQEHHSGVGSRPLIVRNLLETSARVATYRTQIHDVQVVQSSALLKA